MKNCNPPHHQESRQQQNIDINVDNLFSDSVAICIDRTENKSLTTTRAITDDLLLHCDNMAAHRMIQFDN